MAKKGRDDWGLTASQRQMLLFLEDQVVRYAGRIESSVTSDLARQAREWQADGLIRFWRMDVAELLCRDGVFTSRLARYRVQLSDTAWRMAHSLRRRQGELQVATLTAEECRRLLVAGRRKRKAAQHEA